MRFEDVNGLYTSSVQNVDVKAPQRVQVTERLIKKSLFLTNRDIAKWIQAQEAAKRKQNPSRKDLIELWNDINDDGHVTGIIESIKNKCKSKDVQIVDSNGEVDEEATLIFERQWYFKFVDFVVESRFYGYTLVQLGSVVDDAFPDIMSVPRENVVPEENIVLLDARRRFSDKSETNTFDYTARQNRDWFIMIGDDSLGLFNKAAPHAIAKRHLFAAMWEFSELFGMPIRKGKTDIRDPERRKNMEKMLENMGSKAWGVFDTDDDIELIESVKADAEDVFIEPIKVSNQEISKAFAGGVAMFDEKAFVGAAEVQERLFMEFIASFLRNIRFVVNDDLIPRMVKFGMLGDGLSLKFATEDTVTTLQKSVMIKELSPFYRFQPDTVTEAIGIEVDAEASLSDPDEVTSVMPKVAKLYAFMSERSGNDIEEIVNSIEATDEAKMQLIEAVKQAQKEANK